MLWDIQWKMFLKCWPLLLLTSWSVHCLIPSRTRKRQILLLKLFLPKCIKHSKTGHLKVCIKGYSNLFCCCCYYYSCCLITLWFSLCLVEILTKNISSVSVKRRNIRVKTGNQRLMQTKVNKNKKHGLRYVAFYHKDFIDNDNSCEFSSNNDNNNKIRLAWTHRLFTDMFAICPQRTDFLGVLL